jgi:hypothetical protein
MAATAQAPSVLNAKTTQDSSIDPDIQSQTESAGQDVQLKTTRIIPNA